MAPPFSARRPSPGFQPVYSRPRLVQQGAVYIPLSGYAAGLVRLSAGLYVIRFAVLHRNLFLRFLNALFRCLKISGV